MNRLPGDTLRVLGLLIGTGRLSDDAKYSAHIKETIANYTRNICFFLSKGGNLDTARTERRSALRMNKTNKIKRGGKIQEVDRDEARKCI